MIEKIKRVIEAMDNCEGYLLPYPTIKRMHQVKAELQAVIDEQLEIQQGDKP